MLPSILLVVINIFNVYSQDVVIKRKYNKFEKKMGNGFEVEYDLKYLFSILARTSNDLEIIMKMDLEEHDIADLISPTKEESNTFMIGCEYLKRPTGSLIKANSDCKKFGCMLPSPTSEAEYELLLAQAKKIGATYVPLNVVPTGKNL